MTSLDDLLTAERRARLIPSLAQSQKEQRLTSVFLATMAVVRPFAVQLLHGWGQRVSKTSRLTTYTEVEFPASSGDGVQRPDGILVLTTGRRRWTAILEAKADNAVVAEDQVESYGEIALEYEIDALITVSNQLVAVPSHVPYSIRNRKVANKVDFFHTSWVSVRTVARLILRGEEEVDREQKYILEEMTRYLESKNSGLRAFDQMNEEWRDLVLGIRRDNKFQPRTPEIEQTVTSWHQETRDLCLILSRRTGERVDLRLSRKHRTKPELRLLDECTRLSESHELSCTLVVPNAASNIEVTVDLDRRTIACSMQLKARGDRKTARARINWVVRQLQPKRGQESAISEEMCVVRAFWPGRAASTQATLAELKANPGCLATERAGLLPTRFEVRMIADAAGRFSGRRTFIADLEDLVPKFYDQVGQHLRAWVEPPPPIDTVSPGEDAANSARPSMAMGEVDASGSD